MSPDPTPEGITDDTTPDGRRLLRCRAGHTYRGPKWIEPAQLNPWLAGHAGHERPSEESK